MRDTLKGKSNIRYGLLLLETEIKYKEKVNYDFQPLLVAGELYMAGDRR